MVSEFERYVVKAIINYYNYDYEMFFEYLDENAIWYGPNYGQYIVGKENMKAELNKFKRKYEFRLDNITTKMISYSGNVCSVIVTFKLFILNENKCIKEYFQHIIINNQRCKDRDGKDFWRCPFVHISNQILKKDDIDSTFINLASQDSSRLFSDESNPCRHLILPGENHTSLYIRQDSINYIIGGKGVMCYVHTDTQVHLVHKLLKDVMPLLPSYYYRCHSSYIINLRNVIHISSHCITLKDGTQVPISVKKYAKIKADIDAWMLNPSE